MTERITQKFALTAPDGIYTDSSVRGLRLRVRRNGKYRFWIFRRTINRKNYEVHLGKPTETDIGEVRLEAVRLASLQSADFLSLMAQKSSSAPKNDHIPNFNALFEKTDNKQRTFEEVSAIYFAWLEQSKRISFQTFKILRSLVCRHVLPVIGQKYVMDISPSDIAKIVFEMNVGTPSKRVALNRVRNIFDYAKARNFMHGDNPADPKGPLQFLLPADKYVHGHRGALSVEQLPQFFAALMSQPRSMFRSCYIFAILTTVRAQTACRARWDQIDFEKKIWSIPPQQLKVSRNGALIVPLSSQAVDHLMSIPGKREGYIFSTHDPEKHLSKNVGNCVTPAVPGTWLDERQTLEKGTPVTVTLHGISRATFRTWAQDDKLGNDRRFDPRTAELCLHHRLKDAYNGAYERNVWLDRRREMLQAWADYCFSLVDKKYYPVPVPLDSEK